MDLFTLTDTFLAKDVIDQYVSAIWTERYFAAGDCQLVVPAEKSILDKLQEGTYLSLRGSKEVMILDTVSIDKGLATIVGNTLPFFLNNRVAWFKNPASSDAEERVVDYVDATKKPGEFIADVVDKMVINPSSFGGFYAPADLEWADEVIPALELGPVDTAGSVERLTLPLGPLYDGIQQIAEKAGVGFSLYLDSADPVAGYVLKFTTYRGNSHTSDQDVFPLVRLVPELDSLSDVKELRSIANYKNVAYVYYQGDITVHYSDPEYEITPPEGFARRVLITDAEGEPVGHKTSYSSSGGYIYGGGMVVDSGDIAAFREQNAKDALANHNYIRAVDGQTSPANDYTYGVDYNLGDIIELESLLGNISQARVTEYIRSQDQQGSKEYPTISVVTPEV